MENFDTDVLIIGGGLAGLTAALHLHQCGIGCIVIEKNVYPHHKVCGEYLSNEVLPYLKSLNINLDSVAPTKISRFQLSTVSGKNISTELPLGGIGISRYLLDNLIYEQLLANGIQVIHDTVTDVSFDENIFEVQTQSKKLFKAKQVIGAYGKRETLDIKFNRPFIKKKSFFLAVKAHYAGEFPDDLVALHHFNGGYCGVSKVENDILNICYLADYKTFKAFKNIPSFQKNVLYQNKELAQIFESCEMTFEEPITISQLYFKKKEIVIDHMLMIGDTAALIHPLCGNGMAIAIHSAKIASELLNDFLSGKIQSRSELEESYIANWQKEFNFRLKSGRIIATVFRQKTLTSFAINMLIKLPFLLRLIIKQTHGKPLTLK